MDRRTGNFVFEKWPEFDNHELISILNDQTSGLKGFITIHRKRGDNSCFGATRLWRYPNEYRALQDALRLSRTMSYKSALAGLPYGGAKAVIFDTSKNGQQRKKILKSYARILNNFCGSFITGTDVGLHKRDLEIMSLVSPYFVGFNSNPVEFTVVGILNGIEACLDELYGEECIEGRSFAIKGVGKVGWELLRLIYRRAGDIYIADINSARVRSAKKRFPRARVVSHSSIHKLEVDIFSPCALSSALNPTTVRELRCLAVVGGANNQLSSPEMGQRLFDKGVLYAPDYVVNAGGLIAVVDEFENRNYNKKRVEKRISHIKDTLKEIIKVSQRRKKSTEHVANKMAEKIINGI